MFAGKVGQIGVIHFEYSPGINITVNMIELRERKIANKLHVVIRSVSGSFNGADLLRNNAVKLSVNHNIKPVSEPPRRKPYHLKSWANNVISGMMTQNFIEEHSKDKHVPLASNIVVASKDNGKLKMTLDAKKVNEEALLSSNYLIPSFLLAFLSL